MEQVETGAVFQLLIFVALMQVPFQQLGSIDRSTGSFWFKSVLFILELLDIQ